jgi:Leucine-rich repeat (LRR) protein
MKKLLLTLTFLLYGFFANAQTLTIPDATFKAKLLASSTIHPIAYNLSGSLFKIDANNDGEIQQSEALQVKKLRVLSSNIFSLDGIQYFTNLTELDCSGNQLTSLNVNSNTALTVLNCSGNQLASLNVSNNTALTNLRCSSNLLTSLDVNINTALTELRCSLNQLTSLIVSNNTALTYLYCENNLLTSLNVNNNTALTILLCGYNQLTSLNVTNNTGLIELYCYSNQLTNLNVSNNTSLTRLYCFGNLLTNLIVSNNTALTKLDCGANQLTNLNVSSNTALTDLYCGDNQLTSLNVNSNTALTVLNCSGNQLASLNVSNNIALTYLGCGASQLTNLDVSSNTALANLLCDGNLLTSLNVSSNSALTKLSCGGNQLTNLNITNNTALTTLDCNSNQLTNLFIKNNINESTLNFSNNPNLSYICADEGQIGTVQTKINSYGYATTCHVNSYCSFVPGGPFYTIQGTNTLDSTNNGCEATDGGFPNQKFTITNGSISGSLIANASGNYSYSVQAGTHTITPVLENPSYFNVSPSSATVTFPATASPALRNFCITPNGVHHNVEITLLPVTVARPGFDATYKLVYKNLGIQVENGSVTFTYLNQDAYDIVSCNPAFNTENSDGFEKTLTWNYTNLQPLESRVIMVVLNLNGPMETPALNNGDNVNISSKITPVTNDENPIDNQSDIRQVIVGSYDPNDKTCLEGNIISPEMVNKYVHYLIRFENTGTYPAQNVVVKDMIDATKFDISTLTPIDGSHAFETRIAGNKVEFIFQNINLPFADATNDGYVAFKIKTKPTLVLGDTFSNLANIYFDYNFPIITNTATTTIQTLGTPSFDFDANFALYPNPAKNQITLSAKNEIELNSVEIYNTLGQLILVVANAENTSTIDVSALLSGTYFVKINTDKGVSSSKFIKE